MSGIDKSHCNSLAVKLCFAFKFHFESQITNISFVSNSVLHLRICFRKMYPLETCKKAELQKPGVQKGALYVLVEQCLQQHDLVFPGLCFSFKNRRRSPLGFVSPPG